MFERRWLGTWLAVAALGASAHARVLVVDASGAGQFTSINAAVHAAHEGDTILVRTGTYGGFAVSAKSLSIVAESGHIVNVTNDVVVVGLTSAQTVVLAGLRITDTANSSGAFVANSNAGAVRVQGCTFTGHDAFSGNISAEPAASLAANTSGVAFVDCDFFAGDGGFSGYGRGGVAGGDGLVLSGPSQVALYDCNLLGGNGMFGDIYEGGRGGRGASLSNPGAFMHASGSRFYGGHGGDACDLVWSEGGDGGAGVYVEASLFAWMVDSPSLGGAPGGPGSCNGSTGAPGLPFSGTGTHVDFQVAKLQMQAPWLARESTPLPITLQGEPGVEVYLIASDKTIFAGAATWRGVRVVRKVGPLDPQIVLGTMPPSGVMTVNLPIPMLAPSEQAHTYFLQAYRRGPNGIVMGSFSTLTVLDQSF